MAEQCPKCGAPLEDYRANGWWFECKSEENDGVFEPSPECELRCRVAELEAENDRLRAQLDRHQHAMEWLGRQAPLGILVQDRQLVWIDRATGRRVQADTVLDLVEALEEGLS